MFLYKLSAILLFSAIFCFQARSSVVVDDFVLASQNTNLMNLAADQKGNQYAVGYTIPLGQWIVRKSSDFGLTWETADVFQNNGNRSHAESVTVAPSGDIYVTGMHDINPKAENDDWSALVRKSTDQGKSWTTIYSGNDIDDLVGPIAVDKDNNIYMSSPIWSDKWIVRKSSDGGKTWTVVDELPNKGPEKSSPTKIFMDSIGTIYVLGNEERIDPKDHRKNHKKFFVRKSENSGLTWSTVDGLFANNVGGFYTAFFVDSKGVIYVGGDKIDSNDSKFCLQVV